MWSFDNKIHLYGGYTGEGGFDVLFDYHIFDQGILLFNILFLI
jgi:hypothetical protein